MTSLLDMKLCSWSMVASIPPSLQKVDANSGDDSGPAKVILQIEWRLASCHNVQAGW